VVNRYRFEYDAAILLGLFSKTPIFKMKVTEYFTFMSRRPDRKNIKQEWIQRVISSPEKCHIQADQRIRLWGKVPEMDNRYLRVIVLEDGETVHNAFFDRGFKG
jgi:hypothetical protein